MNPPGRHDPVGTPFIGRETELGELRAALQAALGGSARLVLIGGEPGIGKTRLTEVLTAEASALGVPVWWGRGWEDGTAPAFWSWNSALARWSERAGNEAAIDTVGPLAAELSYVFPVLRERIPDLPA